MSLLAALAFLSSTTICVMTHLHTHIQLFSRQKESSNHVKPTCELSASHTHTHTHTHTYDNGNMEIFPCSVQENNRHYLSRLLWVKQTAARCFSVKQYAAVCARLWAVSSVQEAWNSLTVWNLLIGSKFDPDVACKLSMQYVQVVIKSLIAKLKIKGCTFASAPVQSNAKRV